MSLNELTRRLFGSKPERHPEDMRTHAFGDRPETQRVAITQEPEDEELKQFTRNLFNPKK